MDTERFNGPSISRRVLLAAAIAVLPSAVASAGDGAVRLGAGGYAATAPVNAKRPPSTIYRTGRVRGPMPTNDWWSSLAWMRFSERQYAHPLAMQAESRGLRVHYPGNSIRANRHGISGSMPAGKDDLILGHTRVERFPDARVDGFSDWFVTASFASGTSGMRVTYGHGCPYVYATYRGGNPRIQFARPPIIWSGSKDDAVLGLTVGKNHYALFGPTGSKWTGLFTSTLTNVAGDKDYFALAILPDRGERMLKLFQRYAYAHVTDSRMSARFDEATSTVHTRFTATTKAREGGVRGTLFALYPHQWRNTPARKLQEGYASVRGQMKLVQAQSFDVPFRFPGVLPSLPNAGLTKAADKAMLSRLVRHELKGAMPDIADTYSEGKLLGKYAALVPIAQQAGDKEAADQLLQRIRTRLQSWLTPVDAKGRAKNRGVFYYDSNWGTLIGYPASYGSDDQLNDHNFHYGYFLRAAAEVARNDPAWADRSRWGPMVDMLARDIASEKSDAMFPRLRSFDPYAGHSWASGHAKFGDGNNNESTSEAMNAWCAMILWGQATGRRQIRDLGIIQYTLEMSAINEYWFDVHNQNHHANYLPSVVTMMWGGKGANATWFSNKPIHVHGINWLPIHGGSLYLGHYPKYVEKNYAAMVRESGPGKLDQWADLAWMYLALARPQEALGMYRRAAQKYAAEAGNSRANTHHWLHNLAELGPVDAATTADYPLRAVFRTATSKTYVAYVMQDKPRTVTFSDGTKLQANGRGFAVKRRRTQ